MSSGSHLSGKTWLAIVVLTLTDAVAAAHSSKLTYHYDRARTGWNAAEATLSPAVVGGRDFGLKWRSAPFDWVEGRAPRLYATPLYVRSVDMSSLGKGVLSIVYAVASTGYVYAVNASDSRAATPGDIVWRVALSERPCSKGVMGNRSTPVIDLPRNRLYVTACDEDMHWRVHALDLRTGEEATGWPLALSHTALNAPGVNRNGAGRFPERRSSIQRGALNLNADGSRLYVAFGGDYASGWLVSVDTVHARVASAFSSTAKPEELQGGMWAASGPAIDTEGHVYVATGASIVYTQQGAGVEGMFPDSAHNWGQSILKLSDGPQGLQLRGTYTPFNFCQAGAADIDLGSSGPVLIDLDPAQSATPRLLALGANKQGNVYLLDRARMPGDLRKRQPCSSDPRTDSSLWSENAAAPAGPLNVFGPYSDEHGLMDQAKARSTAAFFRTRSGAAYLYVTGSSKTGADHSISAPPSLARLKIGTDSGERAYLRVDAFESAHTFYNPGSPVVTSNGHDDAIVWVLDANAPRSAPMHGEGAPQPVLYAFDASSLKLIWRSGAAELSTSGKYNEPTVIDGMVLVGTDRIEAFGVGKRYVRRDSGRLTRGASVPRAVQEASTASARAKGASVYEQRCEMCHDSGRVGVPPRLALAGLPRAEFLEKLASGSMQNQAFGLTDDELSALADYVLSSQATQ